MVIKLIAVVFLLCLVLRSAISQEPEKVFMSPKMITDDSTKLSLPSLKYDYPFFDPQEEDQKKVEKLMMEIQQASISYRYTYQKELVVPAIICFTGLSVGDKKLTNSPLGKHTVNNYLIETFPNFQTSADDYLQYGPILSVYALNLSGIKGKHDMWTATKLLAVSEALTGGVVHAIKNIAANERPNDANHYSFPSGHTAQSFVAATFLHREYGHLSPWYSVGGYTMATAVGAMRMLNDAHWLNDVCVGAALGMAITNLVYIHHDKRKERKARRLLAAPSIGEDTYLLTMSYKL